MFSFPLQSVKFLLGIFLLTIFYVPSSVFAITAVTTSNTNLVKNGLVGYWSFDGKNMTNATATDISGNGNNGALGSATKRVTGKIGQGLNFNGSTTQVYLGTASNLSFAGPNPHSISVWVKTEVPKSLAITTYNNQSIVSLGSAGCCGEETSLKLRYNGGGGSYRFEFAQSGGGNVTSSTEVQANTWYHVVAVWDGATEYIYINGRLEGANSFAGPISDFTNNHYIGYSQSGAYFKGTIDDVRIYNRPISASEVLALYKAGEGVLSAIAPTTNQNGAGVTSGLVGYWTFDGKHMTNATATDISGNGNNGALSGMTTASSKTIGKLGQALTFDAVDDKINMGTPSALNITSAITISAWIYPRSYGGGSNGRIIVDKNGDATSGYTLFMDNTNRANSITFCTNTCVGPVGTPNVITLNRWQHVVVIQSATTLTHYVNGVQVYSGAAIAAPLTSSNNFVIGGRTVDNARNFDGRIDDVRVYNRNLSLQEVQALYKVGQVATAVSPTINTNSGAVGINNGLVGHFTFDGKNMTNATATDVSGNGNNGTLSGMTTATGAVTGKLGQALSFSSSSLSYVSVPQNGRYNITTTAFTVSFWVKDDTPYNGVATTFHRFISWYDGTNNVQIGLAAASSPAGTRQFYFTNANSNSQPRQMTNVTGGVLPGWRHILATSDGTTYTLYLDGVTNQGGVAINIVGIFSANSTTLYIGQRGDNVAATFTTGSIDDVRFYNRALSAKEALALYKLGSQ